MTIHPDEPIPEFPEPLSGEARGAVLLFKCFMGIVVATILGFALSFFTSGFGFIEGMK